MGARDAEARISAQLPPEKRLASADIVIENTGTLEELAQRVDEVWEELRRRLAARAGSAAGGGFP